MTDAAAEITVRADGPVAWVTIDRPEKRNALSNGMLARIGEALDQLAADRSNRVVVFTGSGDKFFSSGFDIGEIASLPEGGGRAELAPNLVEETMIRVAEFPKPTIACLNGSAFGTGCELATACDLRIAVAGIEMAMPPARVGVLYSAAGIERFIRLAGPAVAKEMFFTARRLASDRLLAIGLLNQVVAREELAGAVAALANEVASSAPNVVRATKAIVNELTFSAARWTMLESRRDAWRRSDELTEGLRAIGAGKKPSFSDPE